MHSYLVHTKPLITDPAHMRRCKNTKNVYAEDGLAEVPSNHDQGHLL